MHFRLGRCSLLATRDSKRGVRSEKTLVTRAVKLVPKKKPGSNLWKTRFLFFSCDRSFLYLSFARLTHWPWPTDNQGFLRPNNSLPKDIGRHTQLFEKLIFEFGSAWGIWLVFAHFLSFMQSAQWAPNCVSILFMWAKTSRPCDLQSIFSPSKPSQHTINWWS